MNLNLIYYGSVQDGKLLIRNQKAFDKEITFLEGKEVEIVIRKKKNHRSPFQNRYYWGAVIPILQDALYESGNIFSKEQIHDLLKYKFLRDDVHVKDGEFLTRIKSTTELTTAEFMDYITQIQQWAAEFFHIDIPNPNEQLQIETDHG